jgi:hypothetical protein
MPAFEVEIFDKGEEILGWQKKEDRKEAANKRVATNQRKPLNLTVGLKVLVEDKQGNNTLPGEVVGVRSQRSCWVQMTDTDRIFLRNRKFLVEDPAFRTDHIINMLKSAVASGDARRGEEAAGIPVWKVPRALICDQRCGEAEPSHVEAEPSLSLTQWRSAEASRSQEQLLLPTRAAAQKGWRSTHPGLSPTSSRAPRGTQLPLQLLSWPAVAVESSSRLQLPPQLPSWPAVAMESSSKLRRSPSPAAAQASRRASWEPVPPALCSSSQAEEQAQGSSRQTWEDKGRRRWTLYERR